MDRMVLASPPIDVYWGGWRSNTHILQNNGWDIAIERKYDRVFNRVHFIFRHRQFELIGIGQGDLPMMYGSFAGTSTDPCPYSITINSVFNNLRTTGTLANYHHVDALPEYMPWVDFCASSLACFKLADKSANDKHLIDAADMSVIDHLEQILKKQAPKQQELREKLEAGQATQSNVIELAKVSNG